MRIDSLFWSACLFVAPVVLCQSAPAPSATFDAESKRERDLKIPEIIRAMELRPGFNAADIGAGEGDYEIALSHAVSAQGRVYAEDISPGAIK